MKVILIEPRVIAANVYSKLRMPLLGPLYLGTILKNRGHDVTIYNENIHTPDYDRLEADVIGISILTSTARRGYEIAAKFPREKVIIGGVHASLLPEEALSHCRQVVVGEAEEVIADVVEGRIKDAIVKGKAVQELDSLPFPDFSLIKGAGVRGIFKPVSTSRGCPFDCSFCSVTKLFGRNYRFRSAANVMKELKGRKEVFFCDDNFCANPKRSAELTEMIIASGKKLDWSCQVRCDVTRDTKLLKSMAASGCRLVCVGLESVNDRTLAAYDKRQTVAEISAAIRAFHKEKIKVHGMFVLGGDDDTARTVWDTFTFAVRHQLDTLQMSILTPFPGTRVHTDLSAEQRIFSRDWNLYDGQHVVFRPRLLSPQELQAHVVKAYASFYSLSNSLSLLFKCRIRNAFFRFMGHSIVKQWMAVNRDFSWLPLSMK